MMDYLRRLDDQEEISAGSPDFLALSIEYSDKKIQDYVQRFYGSRPVEIIRKPHIILVKPKEKDNE